MTAQLVYPSLALKESYIDALKEGFRHWDVEPLTLKEITGIENNFEDYIVSLNDLTGMVKCPDGVERPKVPYDLMWLAEDGQFIGETSIRHKLSDFLEAFGGHIGYRIRPSRQRKGYGKKILALSLDRMREVGVYRVLVTCSPDNPASMRIIESSGGVLEDVRSLSWRPDPVRRYWITLK